MRFLVGEEGCDTEPYDALSPGLAALAYCKEREHDNPDWGTENNNVCVEPGDTRSRALPGWSKDEGGLYRCFRVAPQRVVTWTVAEWTGFHHGGVPKADGEVVHG